MKDSKSTASDWLPSAPNEPLGKLSQRYFDALYRYECRMLAIDGLRQKYQLSLFECQGVAPKVVQERQKAYTEHLNRLKKIWAKEDAELGAP